jgi:hypothetical protein
MQHSQSTRKLLGGPGDGLWHDRLFLAKLLVKPVIVAVFDLRLCRLIYFVMFG